MEILSEVILATLDEMDKNCQMKTAAAEVAKVMQDGKIRSVFDDPDIDRHKNSQNNEKKKNCSELGFGHKTILQAWIDDFSSEFKQQITIDVKEGKEKKKNSNVEIDEEEGNNSTIVESEYGNASLFVTAFGIGKNITGSGIIAMPQIIVFASFIPSILMTLFISYLSMTSFYFLGKCCEASNSKTFKELWHNAFDGKYVWVCQTVLIGLTFFGTVSYVKCFGDFGAYLLQLIPGLAGTLWASKTAAMLYTHVILQFLILSKDLSSLKYASIIGLFAVCYLTLYCIIIGIKYLSGDSSPEMQKMLNQESFEDNLWVFRWSWLAPASTLSSSFICHYNAPKFFCEMQDKPKFKQATQWGFLIALVPNMLVMIFGYLALQNFMSYTPEHLENSGNIITLFGYQEAEGFSPYLIICASLYMLNVIFSYPFIFMSLRDSILEIIFPKGYGLKKRLIVTEIIFITVCLFSLIPVPIDDIIRWKGAFFAPFILCIFPAMFYFKLIPEEKKLKSEIFAVKLIFIFGIFHFFTRSNTKFR
jgi:amino acid permease